MAEEDRLGQRDWGGDTASLGGYGSAGLYSRRRQMERTTGGSFLNISEAPRTGNMGMGGGYVSMPTVGPRPQETTPLVSGPTGPSGPTAMAQGVRGSYAASPPDVPKFGQMAETLSKAGGLVAGAIGAGVGYMRRDRAPMEKVTKFVKENKYDPSLGGSGADIDDINLKYGLPSVRAAGELTAESPVEERQWRSGDPEPMGRSQYGYDDTATRRRGTGAFKQGPIQFAGELEQVAGVRREQPATEARQPRRTPPGTGRAVNPRTTEGTAMEPRIAQMASSYEYPNYNPRLGTKLGRTATRGERTATRDPNQMGLFDPND